MNNSEIKVIMVLKSRVKPRNMIMTKEKNRVVEGGFWKAMTNNRKYIKKKTGEANPPVQKISEQIINDVKNKLIVFCLIEIIKRIIEKKAII